MVEICEQTRPRAGYIPGNLPDSGKEIVTNVLDAVGNVRIAPAAAYWKFGLASVVFLLKPGLSSGGANNRKVAILRFNRRHDSLTRVVTNK